jgi:hypothetical protein
MNRFYEWLRVPANMIFGLLTILLIVNIFFIAATQRRFQEMQLTIARAEVVVEVCSAHLGIDP